MVETEFAKVQHGTESWGRASTWTATAEEGGSPGPVTTDPLHRPTPSVPERGDPVETLGAALSGRTGAFVGAPQARMRGRIMNAVAVSIMMVVAVLIGGHATQEDDPITSRARAASAQRRSVLTEAPWPPEVLDALRRIVIQRDGQLEPFGRFAKETVAFVTGRVRVGHQDPVQTLFSMMATPDDWRGLPLIRVPTRSIREQLGMALAAQRISFSALIDPRTPPTVTHGHHRDQRLAAQREILDVRARGMLLQDLFEQQLHVVPPLPGAGPAWLLLLEPDGYGTDQQIGLKRSWGTLLIALRDGHPEVMRTAVAHLTVLLENLHYPPPSPAMVGWKGYAG